MKNLFFSSLFVAVVASACTQPPAASSSESPNKPPALSSIREDELREDIFTLAGDDMRGKRAGTVDELRAAAWVAEQARQAGLKPAGDDGTYFQFFPLRRKQVAEESKLQVNGQPLTLWEDAWVTSPVAGNINNAPVVWLKSLADTTGQDFTGKVVAMSLQPPATLPAKGMSLWGYRYILSALRQQATTLRSQGASAIVLVSDSMAEANLAFAGHGFEEGTYQLEDAANNQYGSSTPLILVKQKFASNLQQAQAKITAAINVNSYVYPSINVVAVAPGTDPELRDEYVLFSGHHDHDGVGVPIDGDSIWNGADDNASVSVALLAIGRAWTQSLGKRSALFVWHGAEERGLFGSRWYAEHPTVEKESIVAVLNGDMIGRNAPDSAALLGAIPPHRNSTNLVNMAMQANEQLTKFTVDTSWDEASHPEGWYFRSDHLPYARAGIPAIFFTTLLHPDYHTPRDEPKGIDISKLARMTQWMYATGWAVSETAERPDVDPGAKLER
ncbi:M28 family metallopeptidase [Pontibacter silvestris]|uniref:M28 family metallopeptidase n=1 Tax=Pontibacter silvestris TaxID=2305183 RepID=A0ABW4WT23_9BACT|nr:M28 family peptidase [Pontibacter silvestris]MCC9138068.1 M28 family peptidase [Pontibacter silvestris]